RRTVQRLNQANLVFVNYGGVEKAHIEKTGSRFGGPIERHRLGQDAIRSRRKNIHLRPTLTARRNKQLGVLITEMILDRFSQQTARVKRGSVGRGDNPNLALWNHRRLRHGNSEKVRMDRPQSRRQSAQLNSFNPALLDE